MKSRGNNLKILLFILFLGLLSLGKTLNLSYDYLWFEHLGFQQIFWLTLLGKVFTTTLFGISFCLIIFLNLQFVRPGENEVLEWKFYSNKNKTAKSIPLRPQTYDGFILFWSVATGIIMGLVAVPFWRQALKFLYSFQTGIPDPFLGKDISFYLFKLPFYDFFLKWSLSAWSIVFLSVAVFYYREGYFAKDQELTYQRSRQHLAIMAGILFLILAGFTRTKTYDFLFLDNNPAVSGINYIADLKIKIPALRITTILLLCGAVLGIFVNRKSTLKQLAVIAGIIILQYLGMVFISPKGTGPELKDNNSYLAAFIRNKTEATLYAYGLDKIKHRKFNPQTNFHDGPYVTPSLMKKGGSLLRKEDNRSGIFTVKPKGKSAGDKAPHHPELHNIQLWNRKTLLSNFNELLKIRSFYNFSTITIDRYPINGQLTKVALSPRELASNRLSRKSRNWSNLHLKYTHGYGAVLSLLNIADQNKLPFIFSETPSKNALPEITRPEIYYGTETNLFCLVNTKEKEFNLPQNENYEYRGKGGILIKSFLKRLILAWQFNDLQIVRSTHLTSNTRLMSTRNIMDRVKAITPFLYCDNYPYLVISQGKLFWLINIYTVTDRYPGSYLTEKDNLNYIRNSAMAVIDAYNGKVDYYMRDGKDPLINIWSKIYPQLFKPINKMPGEIKKHLKYPGKLLEIQMGTYSKFHLKDPKPLPGESDKRKSRSPPPPPSFYRTARKQDGTEGLFLYAFQEHSRKNSFISRVKVGCDINNYGNITVEWFPQKQLPPNIGTVEKRIGKNKIIQENLNKLKAENSNLVLGAWEPIAYEDDFLYVQPIYSMASNSELYKLKQVRAVYKNRLAMEADFEKALDAVLIGYKEKPDKIDLRTYQAWSRQAWKHLRKSREALMKTDWKTYGKEMKALELILQKMAQRND